MALNIDSSRALRSPQELVALVQAVLAASENDEMTWVEWKNGLVLQDKEARVNIARHILGMANRLPEEAVRHAEGCGYIVIGAEPGTCSGVTEIDPAHLDAGLRPYLGSDGPRWSAQYIKTQGKSVLVITVDPPRRGDREFTLQKAYHNNQTNYYAGMIFVRRPGRTIPAEPGDVRALEDRFAATDNPITLHVRFTEEDLTTAIPSVINLRELISDWEDQKRAELLSQSERKAPAEEQQSEDTKGFRIADEALKAVEETETRAAEEHRVEVDRYIADSRQYYIYLVAAKFAKKPEAKLSLDLVNTSDRNYADVHVDLYIPWVVLVADPDSLADIGEPPDPPGTRRTHIPSTLTTLQVGSVFNTPFNFSPTAPATPPFTIKQKGNFHVVGYEVGRIRPEQTISLSPIFMLGFQQPSGELQLSWTVTSSNVDGVARGEFTVATGELIEATDLISSLPESESVRK